MDNITLGQFKKGAIELIVLRVIEKGEKYGYEIVSELNGYSSVLGEAKEGTVYPILYRLCVNGLVSVRTEPKQGRGNPKKYYSLTEKGKTALEELKKFWFEFSDCVDSILTVKREAVVVDLSAKDCDEVLSEPCVLSRGGSVSETARNI